jgi:hypothetical protein
MAGNVRDFGAVGDGVADDTAAIRSACAAERDVFFPRGKYKITGPIVTQRGAVIAGEKWEETRLQRHGVWDGHTFEIGGNGIGSYAFEVHNLLFEQMHPDFVQGLSTSMADRLTGDQTHLFVKGGTNGIVRDCWFEGCVYSIRAYGHTSLNIEHNFFRGSWDSENAAVSETRAHIVIGNHPTHGIATLNRIKNNYIAGGPLPVRSYTIDGVTFEMSRDGGALYGALVNGAEGLEVSGNYIGGQNGYSMLFLPQGSICSNIDIHDNFFDGNILGTIAFSAADPASYTNIISIHDNRFNGQFDSPRALEVLNNGGHHTASMLVFESNILNAHIKTPLVLFGLSGGSIKNNIVTGYNARGITAVSPDNAAGAYVGQISREVDFSGNKWGGGVNNMAASNNCVWGIVREGGTNITASNERGILGKPGGAVVAGVNPDSSPFKQTYPS